MDEFIQKITDHASTINWQGPAVFVAAVVVIFSLFRKWSLVLLVLLTVAIGWGAEDLILFNLETENEMVSVPLVVYCVGGVSVFLLAMYSLFKSK